MSSESESKEVDRDCHDWWSLGGRRRSHDMDRPALDATLLHVAGAGEEKSIPLAVSL